MAAAWLLNLPESAAGGFAPVDGVDLILTTGPGSTSNGKLPESIRAALQGGEYPEAALRLAVTLVDPTETESWDLIAVLAELGETTLELFGAHPKQPGDLQTPQFSISITNETGMFTPGRPGSIFPEDDLAGWSLDVVVREYLSDPNGGAELFRQRLVLAELTTTHQAEVPIASLLGIHPVGGWLSQSWAREDGTSVDWQGGQH